MRKIYNYRLSKENLWEMLHAQRHHLRLVITFKDKSGSHTHKLSADYQDDIDVYREDGKTYVLTRNHRFHSVGLEIFEGAEKQGEIFLQGDQVKEILGNENLNPLKAIRQMVKHM